MMLGAASKCSLAQGSPWLWLCRVAEPVFATARVLGSALLRVAILCLQEGQHHQIFRMEWNGMGIEWNRNRTEQNRIE